MTPDGMDVNGKNQRGAFWRGFAFSAVLFLALGAGMFYWNKNAPKPGPGQAASQESAATPAQKPSAAKNPTILYWQDPMHPQYTSDKPGKAPDCGMDLVPVYADDAASQPEHPEGAFRITPEKQQLIGVQFSEASLQPLSKTIRAVARLAYDETRIVRVHSKIAGWIEQVHGDFTGQLVRKNQPLLTIYSPELLATQEEYLLALKARERLASSGFQEVVNGSNSLVEAARRRLELWDVTDEQIAELERTRRPVKAITLYSPASGFITARNAFERQRVVPETELYAISDLSSIWMIADVYEFEAPLVRLGQAVKMTLASSPGREFWGKVSYIYPQLDNATRTLKVRADFANPDFALKPDMYANAELKVDFGTQLSVPQEAVLDSGSQQLVFVALGQGYFEPRPVHLGAKVDNVYIVLHGLKRGERVVTSANFLIDSESKLKAAAGGMGMPGMNHGADSMPEPQPGADHSGHQPDGLSSPTPPAEHPQQPKAPEQHRHD